MMQQDAKINSAMMDTERQFFSERVRLLHKNLLVGLVGNLLCSLVIVYALLKQVKSTYLITWLSATIIILVIRGFLLFFYQKSPKNYRFYFHVYFIGSTLAAILWGLMGSFFMSHSDVVHEMLIVILIAGVTAGALQTLQPSVLINSAYMLCAIGPLAVWLLTRGKEAYFLVGIAMVIYLIFVLVLARRGYQIILEALKLRFENADLVVRLEKINNNLNKEIVKRKAVQAQLEFMASHDPLTDLPNRIILDENFNAILARNKTNHHKFAVIFLDIDDFKHINDTYGHPMGDKILTLVGQRLQGCIRDSDLLIRMGGDEFIVVLEKIEDKVSVDLLLNKMRDSFRDVFHVNGQNISVTISMGISIYPDNGSDQNTLLKKADVALYMAKKEGKNCYAYYTRDEES